MKAAFNLYMHSQIASSLPHCAHRLVAFTTRDKNKYNIFNLPLPRSLPRSTGTHPVLKIQLSGVLALHPGKIPPGRDTGSLTAAVEHQGSTSFQWRLNSRAYTRDLMTCQWGVAGGRSKSTLDAGRRRCVGGRRRIILPLIFETRA